MAKCLSLSGFQWTKCRKHVTGPTYPFACSGGRIQSANIIRGAGNVLQVQRSGSSANCVPAQMVGADEKQTGNHGIMNGSGGEGAHFKQHDDSG